MDKLAEKVESFINGYKIRGNVLVAFSGGTDSMCLLDIVHKLAEKYNINLTAIHLNHNWRGAHSRQDEENCKEFCKNHRINFYSETLPENVPHTETAARDARYAFFEKCAAKFNSNIVLTAHNASDNAETVLYRVFKGTGIKGLEGIKKARRIYYRPLLDVYRNEIENYCTENQLLPNIDESNSDTKYKRNLIRHEILKNAEKINPCVQEAINILSERAAEANQIIDEYITKIKSEIQNDPDIDAQKFAKLSIAIQNRIIYDIFQKNNLDTDSEKIARTVKFIAKCIVLKSGSTLSLNSDLFLFASNRIISLQKQSNKCAFSINIDKTGEYETPSGTFILERCLDEMPEIKKTNEYYAYVSLDKINYTLRTRIDGDIIQPLGMKGHQKLKKYLNEKKISNYEKDRIVLLTDGKEVLWAAGCGVSEKIKAGQKPTHVLKFIKREAGYGN